MPRKTDKAVKQDRETAIMKLIANRAGYYRRNLHRFCYDYLGITNLKWFQKILLWMMDNYDNSLILATRGIGKTYICALYATCRAILYPGQLVICVSSSYKQARNIIKKITEDFMLKSALLRSEIKTTNDGQNECYILFKNGSVIRAITLTETSRGFRSHILIKDERRLMPNSGVDSILRPMNAVPRQPKYLEKYPEKAEMVKEIDLSSAWYAMSELYDITKSYFKGMMHGGNSYCVVDLPYMLSIKEGLLMRQQIENEMSQATFNDITFMMEREGRFYGSTADAIFDYNIINKKRVIVDAFKPLEYYRECHLKVPDKQDSEVRVLSLDIALMASRRHRNDASCFIIHSAIPTASNSYIDNLVYVENKEGLVTDELGLMAMRYFYQYNCDYIVMDSTGVGQGVVDYIMADRYDPVYNQNYPAISCMNNEDLALRCKYKGAPKVLYAIKANAKSNNDMILSLRSGFQNGYINLLVDENESEKAVMRARGYKGLSDDMKSQLHMPYFQTTMLVNELINLDYETNGGLVKVREKPGMRKDRFSSCEYGWAFIQELNKKLKPKESMGITNYKTIFKARAPRKVKSYS